MNRKKATSNLKTAFVHTVFFWLKNPDNAAEKAQLETGLRSLTAIDAIKTAYIGQPASTNRGVIDTSYSFSITFIFDNKEDQDVYQVHPIHLAFVESCKHLWEKVIVYDAVS
jgi:Stress responsive A/B Barrel Domain